MPEQSGRPKQRPQQVKGKPILSLDVAGPGQVIPPADPEPDERPQIDFDRLIRVTGFNLIEKHVFTAHWRRGVPRYQLASTLGLSAKQVLQSLDSIEAKLRTPAAASSVSFRGSSLSLAFRERVGGTPRWTLAELDQNFAEVMRDEGVYSLISQRDASQIQEKSRFRVRISERVFMATVPELKQRLIEERSKLERLKLRAHRSTVAGEEAAADVAKIEAEIAAAHATSVFEEKTWPAPESVKKLAAARALILSSQGEVAAARTAVGRQVGVVEKIEVEVTERQHELVRAAITSTRAECLAALDGAVKATSKMFAAIQATGSKAWLDELLPPTTDSDYAERIHMLNVLDTLVGLNQSPMGFDGDPYLRRLKAVA